MFSSLTTTRTCGDLYAWHWRSWTITSGRPTGQTQAQELLSNAVCDVAFLDLRLGKENGLDVLPSLLRLAPGLQVIVITAYATIQTAVEAMRRGASDFLPKPFTPDELRLVLDRVARLRQLQTHVEDLEEQVRLVVPEADLQTQEPAVQQALEIASKAAASDATILIRGESGTGKGVLARSIHARSPRAKGPFMTVNCPSLSAELLESELFGHVRALSRAQSGIPWVRLPLPKVARFSWMRSVICRCLYNPSSCACSRRDVMSASARHKLGRVTCASWLRPTGT